MPNNAFYKGSLTTIVRQLLDRDGAMYGYEITQKVKRLTNGKIDIKEGALYPLLHKLVASGHVTVVVKKVDNRVRKYYQLTESGEAETASKMKELREYFQTMNSLISLKPIVT